MMPVNINGYNLSFSNGLAFGSSSTRLDSSGRVIMPLVPASFSSKVGNQNANIREYPWNGNSVVVNVNNVYSGGVFTCPVAGLYHVSGGFLCRGSASPTATVTGSGYVGLVKNGGLVYFTHWSTNDDWDTQNLEVIIRCAAGDTLSFAVHISPAPNNNSGNGAYGDNHNMQTIYLLG